MRALLLILQEASPLKFHRKFMHVNVQRVQGLAVLMSREKRFDIT